MASLPFRLAGHVLGGRLEWPGGIVDPPLGRFLAAGYALGVDLHQHVYAVACPLGDLGGVTRGVEPGGYRGVPKVVWALCDQ